MITSQHQEELIHLAYVQAVAAGAGANTAFSHYDYGIDVSFGMVERTYKGTNSKGQSLYDYYENGIKIASQLKATITWQASAADIIYDLDADAYNKIIRMNAKRNGTPMILILLCLPRHKTRWMSVGAQELVLRNCCYWIKLQGQTTNNSSSIRIRIPKHQVFDPKALSVILSQIENGAF